MLGFWCQPEKELVFLEEMSPISGHFTGEIGIQKRVMGEITLCPDPPS